MIHISEIARQRYGTLITTQGTLTEKLKLTWYVDDGTAEVPIDFRHIRKNMQQEPPAIKTAAVGDSVAIIGIVENGTGGTRITPRSPADIAILDSGAASTSILLNETTQTTPSHERNSWLPFLARAGLLTGLLLALFAWYRMRRK